MRKTFNLNYNSNIAMKIELYRAKDEFSIGLSFQNDFEDTINLNLTLPFLFKFYLSFDTKLCKTKWWRKFLMLDDEHRYAGREFAIEITPDDVVGGKDYYLSLSFATYPWDSGGGYSFFKSLNDLIYGNFNYTRKILNEWQRIIFIPSKGNYPEGLYEVLIKEELCEWKWERFNKEYSLKSFDIECEKGIPHRYKYGKPDSCFGMSCVASNVDVAIEKFIDDIQQERSKNH